MSVASEAPITAKDGTMRSTRIDRQNHEARIAVPMGFRLRSSLIWALVQIYFEKLIIAHGARVMRIALATVFIWFGLLKLIGRSPVADLVAQSVPYLPHELFFPALGVGEMILGVGLVFNRTLYLATLLLCIHLLIATFSVILFQPGIAFQAGNPLYPSTEGQYVIKNLVLIAAALHVRGSYRRSQRDSAARVKDQIRSTP